MKLYKVSLTADFGCYDGRSIWTARKSDIPRLKRELSELPYGDCWPEPTVEEVTFDTSVQGLLIMLNLHANRG